MDAAIKAAGIAGVAVAATLFVAEGTGAMMDTAGWTATDDDFVAAGSPVLVSTVGQTEAWDLHVTNNGRDASGFRVVFNKPWSDSHDHITAPGCKTEPDGPQFWQFATALDCSIPLASGASTTLHISDRPVVVGDSAGAQASIYRPGPRTKPATRIDLKQRVVPASGQDLG